MKTNLETVNKGPAIGDNSGEKRVPIGERRPTPQYLRTNKRPYWLLVITLRRSYHQTGLPPTLRELTAASGFKSLSATRHALGRLAAWEYVRAVDRDGKTFYLPTDPTPGDLLKRIQTLAAQLAAPRKIEH